MQKAFDLIVERLEECTIKSKDSLAFFNECGVKFVSANKAIEIVNKVAEEYKSTEHINCSTDDLISRSALLGAMDKRYKEKEGNVLDNLAEGFMQMEKLIKEQPTVSVNDGWIPCSERLPKVETEVLIYARRKYTGGHFKDIITTAMYEDGTVRENDSCWRWEEIEGEWDEEEDCYIIPEGWWENKHYNPDGELNYAVDDKILAWRELPQPYQPKGE